MAQTAKGRGHRVFAATALLLVASYVVSGFSRGRIVRGVRLQPDRVVADDAAAVKQRLVGNWKLVKYEVFSQTGETRRGNFDAGRIMYGDRGEMTAHLLRTGVAKDAPTTESARAAAYQAYIGYFGPYTIDADKGIVVHHVAGSSFPHWIGTDQVRHYGFPADGQLTLSLKSGDRITQTLTWERVW